jgi:hypothetical protein
LNEEANNVNFEGLVAIHFCLPPARAKMFHAISQSSGLEPMPELNNGYLRYNPK